MAWANREMGADRPFSKKNYIASPRYGGAATTTTNTWRKQVTLGGAIIHDISFVSPTIGYAAAELGQVWKTTDAGQTWTQVMGLGFPYYWYGVHALTANDVVISGFNDRNSNGLIRWSHDGGATWSDDIVLSSTNWSTRVRFVSSNQGLMIDSISGSTVHYTLDGGAAAADWTEASPVPWGDWFGDQFSLLPDLHVATSGIKYCASTDGGITFGCRPSIDSVFDGPVFFSDKDHGWVGGGEIAPSVEGWMHRTTDGGSTWSGRVFDGPWPIREILFISNSTGWAAGGNIYSNVGGIYFSADGGQTWSQDLDSLGNEMDACDSQPVGDAYQVWCAGYNSSYNGVVYTAMGTSTPGFTPAPGSFGGSQLVSLSDATPGAIIYYTTDGSSPTTASSVYSGAITVAKTVTIQAMATAPGTAPSMMGAGTYTITPTLAVSGGNSGVTVKAGGSATVPLTVAASADAAGVTLSCSGLPAGAQCSFSPTSVNASTTPTAVTLTISTASTTAQSRTGLIMLSAVLLPGLLLLPGTRARLQKWIGILGVGLIIGLAGCGNSNSTPSPTPQPVRATVTITAQAAGATSATATIPLTINP